MLIKILYLTVCIIGFISTLLMILSRQPITRLALLIKVFIMSAFLFLFLDYYFLGLTYIIVYVGAIAVLFLFVIMMSETNITPTAPKNTISSSLEPASLMLKDVDKWIIRLPKKNATIFVPLLYLLLFLGAAPYFGALSSFGTAPSLLGVGAVSDVFNYHFNDFSSSFITFTDIHIFGFLLYLALAPITIYLGIILWCVLIGILKITL